MDVKYPTCCGVDVHRDFLVATIIKSDNIKPTYIKRRFSTFNNSLLEFKQWLLDNNCYDLCMESTGKYWIPVYNILEDSIRVTVANPKWVKAIKGQKDDVKDSKWIGDLFRMGMVPGSYIPDKNIRLLRECTRYRYKLVSARSSEKNRFQNCFTVCNFALDKVVSDMFGKTATNIINYVLNNNTYCNDNITSLIDGRIKASNEDILNAINGSSFEDSQKQRIKIIQEHMNKIDDCISKLDVIINNLVSNYTNSINLLCTIPGIKRDSAITIISEIGTDMSKFDSARRLTSWAGLVPCNNESAGKKKSIKISRAGVYLKPALVQVAHAAVKATHSNYFANKYSRIAKRRGKKRAIIAIARMILTSIYHMLLTGETFNPSDLKDIEMPDNVVIKNAKHNIKESIKTLLNKGLTPDEINQLIDK